MVPFFLLSLSSPSRCLPCAIPFFFPATSSFWQRSRERQQISLLPPPSSSLSRFLRFSRLSLSRTLSFPQSPPTSAWASSESPQSDPRSESGSLSRFAPVSSLASALLLPLFPSFSSRCLFSLRRSQKEETKSNALHTVYYERDELLKACRVRPTRKKEGEAAEAAQRERRRGWTNESRETAKRERKECLVGERNKRAGKTEEGNGEL